MNSTKSQIILIALGLFLWAHFIPAIVSPPWANLDNILIEEEFSFSTKMYGSDLDPGMTISEFEELLIEGHIRKWITLAIFFVLGIYSCWLILKNSKYWPFLVFLLSGSISIYTIPPIIDLFNFHSSWGEHLNWLIGYISKKASSFEELLVAYSFVMNVYISPVLFGGLFLYSIYEIADRIRKRVVAA